MNLYLRAAASSFTWRRVAVTQTLALVVGIFTSLDWGVYGEKLIHNPSMHFVTFSTYAFVILPIAFCADATIARGAKPLIVYFLLLVFVNPLTAVAVAGVVMWIYSIVFAFPWPTPRWGFTEAGIHFCVPCAFGLLVFMNGRAAKRTLEGVRSAELRRVKLDQQLVESRLATAEAQIDPQMLFGALAEVKLGLEQSQPEAEKTLNELIQKLRTALTRTAAVTSQSHSE